VRNVRRALATLAGVEVVKADPASKQVQLCYQPGQTSFEMIKQTLASAKYPIADEQVESQSNS
jgi:copper chaperone CopZ